jgi:hypothetical protein
MKFNIILLIIFLLTSCSTRKQTHSSRQQTDSLRQTSRLSVRTTKIPESRARLTVPVGTLKKLPAGAAFVQKSGQATAEIRFLHDTLFVYATCDSLQALVYQYEEETEQLHVRLENSQTKKSQKQRTVLGIFGLLFIVCLFFKWRRVRDI